MKVLVVSDSHGNIKALKRAAAVTGPDLILHLGDHDSDCDDLRRDMPDVMIRAVRGNCDPKSKELDADVFVLEGVRFFMVHGHNHGVKYSLDALITAGMYMEADVVLFGHTHRPYAKYYEDMLVLNPGSVGMNRKTYAVLEIGHGEVRYELCELGIWD